MNNNPLKVNIGFIVHESVGYSHEFQFDIEEVDFLDDYVATDLEGTLRFDRTQKGLIAEGNFQVEVINECVRCLDTFSHKISFTFTELFAFSEKNMTEDELLVPDSGQLELEPIFRDFMLLNIPSNALCQEDCKGLCGTCGTNKNSAECDCEEDVVDPRLSKLKDLLDKEE